ncbi:putative carbonic anhydrase-like protein 2 [Liolophura sinensis]|uniref:putative carbonic anhydrase-like protein 2 n=1 Tax=Liolophura sinensis TaxID=3198878 RepID=UPI00315842BD
MNRKRNVMRKEPLKDTRSRGLRGSVGPEYWGLLNSDWRLCNRGRYQSPINIDPHNLVFDPLLTQIFIDNKEVWVCIVNTGHDVTFRLENGESITMLGGPFAYTYRIYQIKVHFGSNYAKGSEHSIAEKYFPVEFQFLGYNENLYVNASVAASAPHGLAGLTVFAQIDNSSSPEMENVFDQIRLIPYKGNTTMTSIDLKALLPKTPFS